MADYRSPSPSLEKSHELASPTPSELEEPFTYTAEEERRVFWKLNFTLLSLLFLGFYVFQLERGNISNALTDGLIFPFNDGQSLLYAGIILLEIPSQYVLQWVGPRYWISFQVLAFGLVGTLQAFQHNHGTFLATRILLGVTECGYIPGSLYTLSTFYKRNELARVTAIFFLGSNLASATSGLLAYGIFPLGAIYKQYHAYQWLMIIEGSMTCFVALLLITFLPGSPTRPRLLFLPIRYFTDREERIVAARVVNDDAAKSESSRRLTVKEVFGALSNWRIYPHLIFAISYTSPTAAIGTYAPSIIRSFNFDTLTANALSSVGGWGMIVMTFVYGYTSDKTRIRGPLAIGGASLALAFWIAFQQKSTSSDRWLKYALLVITQSLQMTFHSVNIAWLSLNCRTPQERAIAMAMFIMAANTGGLIGSQLLRGDDAPLYPRGFKVCVSLMAFGVLVASLHHVQYRLSNRRLERKGQDEEVAAFKGGVVGFRHTL